MKRFTLLLTLIIFATPIAAEAPPSVAMLSLFYNGMKARVADEDIRTKFAEIDVAIGEAYRSGHSGEVRRHLSRGLSLAAGRGWGAQQEYEASLTARTDGRCFYGPRLSFDSPVVAAVSSFCSGR